MMLDHQVLCLPAQDDDEFGGDGGGFVFDSPCKSSEASPLNLDSILSPGKQRSDQQVADEFNAENFPMGLNCRQDLIDEEDDEQRDQQVEAIDLLIESNDDSLSHANAEQNAEALNNTNANQSSAKNNSLLASDLSYIAGENNREYYAKESQQPFGGLGMVVSLADRKPRPIDYSQCASFNDSKYAFSLLDNLFLEPESKQLKFLEFQRLTVQFYSRSTPSTGIKLPLADRDAKSFCLTGRFSMLRNFACPNVFMYDNHACVSLRDLLDHKLADGTSFDFVQDHLGARSKSGLNGTPAATKLLEDMIRDNQGDSTNCAFGYIILWSDSFLRCFSRQRENSIWLLFSE